MIGVMGVYGSPARRARGGDATREAPWPHVRHFPRNTTKPFASADIISTGKGLLDRLALVVAGARFELWARPLKFDFLLTY